MGSFIRPRLVSLGLSLNRTLVGFAGGGLVVLACVGGRLRTVGFVTVAEVVLGATAPGSRSTSSTERSGV